MTLRFFILAKTVTLCGRTQDTLLLKETKHQLSVYDTMPKYKGSFMLVLHCNSDRALLQ